MPGVPPRTFTKKQVETVRRMHSEGYSRTEVAEAIGLRSYTQLNWHVSQGVFGKLPNRQGQRRRGPQKKDNESTGQLFGQRKQDWQRRLKGVQQRWSPEEEQRRQKGIMPAGERAYGLKDKPGHRNQWSK